MVLTMGMYDYVNDDIVITYFPSSSFLTARPIFSRI
jgi:hypothetical protein